MCMCLCVYVSMCLCVYVSVCKCRCIWPVCVCLLFVCVTYVYVCLCVCVRVRAWLPFLFRQELEATHTGRQQGHRQQQYDKHKQNIEKTRLQAQTRVHGDKILRESSSIFLKCYCGEWILANMLLWLGEW